MKAHTNHFLQTLFFLAFLSLLGIKAAYGQSITPAGDTPTTISSPVNHPDQFDIKGGTQSGANLFHSFYQFGLSSGQIANFLSSPSIQTILGRVVGGNASVINGLLQVTGGSSNLFLMNPAGIIFGPHARLNVPASFMATTANGIQMGDRWFNASGPNYYPSLGGTPNAVAFLGRNPGAILNAGTLQVSSGQSVTLLSGTVINTGTITAPGGTITIAAVPGENMVSIRQPGSLLSLNLPLQNTSGLNPPSVTPLSLPALLTGGGMPEATGVTVENGVVRLVGSAAPISTAAGTTLNTGRLSASSAIAEGNGGHVILWGNATQVQGSITANAGVAGGNGGWVETSGQQQLDVTGVQVEASAPQGLPGTWVIDPSDITIANAGGTTTPAQLEMTLDRGTNIILTTAEGTGGNGDITLANSINQLGGGIASLTLTGRRFTNPDNRTISMTSTGGLTFNLNQVNPEANAPTRSIQSAVNAIGAVAGSRTINLGPGTYSGQTLTIDRTLNLNGSGASKTILSGNNAYRVMTIMPGNTVTIEGVAIANGRGSFNTNEAYGGGIYNRGGTLTLYNSIISNNLATAGMLSLGGGIYNQGGTLTLYSSTISDNSINSYYGAGAGIYNEAGLVTLNNSTLSNNLIPFGRGAFGGGIYSKGGRLTLNNSTLADNSVLAMTGSRGGGIYNEGGTLTITNSTLSGNSSRGIRDFGGGGIYNQRGVVFLNNSTLSGNSSLYAGGGIYNEAGLLTITNSTLSGNSALYDGSVGGGVYNGSRTQASTLIIRNSLIASNNATTGREVANQGTAISEGYNLFGYNRSSGVDGMTLNATDVVPNVSLDRILAPLANNGGPTQTHALVPGSPAINTGDPNLITPDQRGFPRFGRADIGAFEFQSFNLLPEPPEGNLPEITLPVFSLADISEITAALYGQETRLPILTLQPQPNKPILCVIRRQAGNGQQRDEYGGLPDCP